MTPNPLTFRPDQIATYRLEALSFFLVLTLLLAVAVKWIWNALQKDFPNLPKLTYLRALGLVMLWGLLISVILSMTTAARELMTPGVWERSGFQYHPVDAEKKLLEDRKAAIGRIKADLFAYAKSHDGKFPSNEWVPEIPAADWEIPHPSKQSFIYVPGRKMIEKGGATLAYEPDVFGDERFCVLTDGQIVRLTASELVSHYHEGAGQ